MTVTILISRRTTAANPLVILSDAPTLRRVEGPKSARFALSLLLIPALFLAGCTSLPLALITPAPAPPQAAASPTPAAGPVVIHKSFLGQVGPIPETVVFTPTTDCDCLVSIYLTAGPATSAGVIEAHPVWQDENGDAFPFNPPFSVQLRTAPGVGQQSTSTVMIHAQAGVPISVSGSNTTDTVNKYDAFVTVQPLQ